MTWSIEDHPDGGLRVIRLAPPRFTARWTTGEFPLEHVRSCELFWTDEGRSEVDMIHLYGFVLIDARPARTDFEKLMGEAVSAIEAWICKIL